MRNYDFKYRKNKLDSYLRLKENKGVHLVSKLGNDFKLSDKIQFVCDCHGGFVRDLKNVRRYLCVKCFRENELRIVNRCVKKRKFVGDVLKKRVGSVLSLDVNSKVSLVSDLDGKTMEDSVTWKCSEHGEFDRKLKYVFSTANKKNKICVECRGRCRNSKGRVGKGDIRNSEKNESECIESKDSKSLDKLLSSFSSDKYVDSCFKSLKDSLLDLNSIMSRLWSKSIKDTDLLEIHSDLMKCYLDSKGSLYRIERFLSIEGGKDEK